MIRQDNNYVIHYLTRNVISAGGGGGLPRPRCLPQPIKAGIVTSYPCFTQVCKQTPLHTGNYELSYNNNYISHALGRMYTNNMFRLCVLGATVMHVLSVKLLLSIYGTVLGFRIVCCIYNRYCEAISVYSIQILSAAF